MSEQLKSTQQESLKPIESAERMQELAERFDDSLEHSGEEAQETAEQARSKVESHALSKEKVAAQSEKSAPVDNRILSKADRDNSFNDTINVVQQRLSPVEKRFSKAIHNRSVEKTSDVLQNSVGKSSILIGGFSATFIGSLLLYIVARRNGYSLENNYTFMAILFATGAICGLVVELLVKSYRNKQSL